MGNDVGWGMNPSLNAGMGTFIFQWYLTLLQTPRKETGKKEKHLRLKTRFRRPPWWPFLLHINRKLTFPVKGVTRFTLMDSIFIVQHRVVSQNTTFPLYRLGVTPVIRFSQKAARKGSKR